MRFRAPGRSARNLAVFALGASLVTSSAMVPMAHAAMTLAQVQAQVDRLEQQATSIAEGAQQAQVDYNNLSRTLASVQRMASADQKTVSQYQKSLGAIAIEQYKNLGMSQSFQLLFSSNPSLYLAEAGALDSVTKKKSLQLRQFQVAKQRLVATSLTVNDKIKLVRAARDKYLRQQSEAQAKLKAAQQLLSQLTKADRIRLAKLNQKRDKQAQAYSLKEISSLRLGSTRGASALKYAIKQIGDRYVFGAAGPTYWDCSGLTMRAFGNAGVSLPHSAAYQFNYGRYVPRNMLKPGDLVFFGRPIDHVGIFLGGNLMVDAPHAGARVRVESFGSYFGYAPYVGARRI